MESFNQRVQLYQRVALEKRRTSLFKTENGERKLQQTCVYVNVGVYLLTFLSIRFNLVLGRAPLRDMQSLLSMAIVSLVGVFLFTHYGLSLYAPFDRHHEIKSKPPHWNPSLRRTTLIVIAITFSFIFNLFSIGVLTILTIWNSGIRFFLVRNSLWRLFEFIHFGLYLISLSPPPFPPFPL